MCLALIITANSHARPIFDLTTSARRLSLSENGRSTVNFTIRNRSGVPLTITDTEAKPSNQKVLGAVITNNTCINQRINHNGSCQIQSRVQGKGVSGESNFDVWVCANNGATCSGLKSLIKVSVGTGNTPTEASISVSGSPLTLQIGGGTGSLTITNTSNMTATNITADLSGTALENEVTITTNNCGSLAPGNRCTIVFRSGNNNIAPTNVPIQGDNTSTVTGQIRVRTLMAYVSREALGATRLAYCQVGLDGFFTGCNLTAASFDRASSTTLFNDNTMAYVTNFGNNTVTRCNVDPATGNLILCNPANAANLTQPVRMRLSDNETIANISNLGSDMAVCNVNPNNFDLDACGLVANLGTGGAYNTPGGLDFNQANTRAYVANGGSNNIFICPFANNNPNFANCAIAAADIGSPSGFALSNDGVYAYIVRFVGSRVFKCTVNQNDGSLFNCNDAGLGAIFNAPLGVALNANNPQAYITSQGLSQVLVCTIAQNGDFSVCNDSSAGAFFNGPDGITLAFIG